MTRPDDHANAHEIDAYLDGALTADQRDDFSRLLSASRHLQAEIELQSRVDASLFRLFAAPQPPHDLALQIRRSPAAAPAPPVSRRRWGKVAALASAAAIVWGILAWNFFTGRADSPHYNPNLPLEAIYEKCVADGFRPKWVCEDTHEFAATFLARQGQGLLLAEMPAGTKMEGLTYVGGISRYTTTMLARVNAQPVMLFVDRLAADTRPSLSAGETKLHLFRKELGPLVLYELTPLDQPKVSEYLHLSEVPRK
jgi:hypothetical protein